VDIAALVTLAFVASITPGPNNLMLFASGMNHGVRKTLRHVLGVSLGFGFLLWLIALGLGAIFDRYSSVEVFLKAAGATYLAYLAWQIFNASGVKTEEGGVAPPLTFLQAAAFQWVNPKAWVMGTTATSTLLVTDGSVVGGATALAGTFWLVNLPCILAWMFSGVYASRWVDNVARVRSINRLLGLLLGATVVLLVL
jgi:threonine/homoserine/homoserine lactone efflux protein